MPGVVDVGGYLGNLEVGEGRDGGHLLVEGDAVYGYFAALAIADEAHYCFKVVAEVVGVFDRGIEPPQAGAVFLVAVATVFDVQLLALYVVLLVFGVGA